MGRSVKAVEMDLGLGPGLVGTGVCFCFFFLFLFAFIVPCSSKVLTFKTTVSYSIHVRLAYHKNGIGTYIAYLAHRAHSKSSSDVSEFWR